jgi:hypothetical protein
MPLGPAEALVYRSVLRHARKIEARVLLGGWNDSSARTGESDRTASSTLAEHFEPLIQRIEEFPNGVPLNEKLCPLVWSRAIRSELGEAEAIGIGDRVEVLYKDVWYIGEVKETPDSDPNPGSRRWQVQCDVDPKGVVTCKCIIFAGGLFVIHSHHPICRWSEDSENRQGFGTKRAWGCSRARGV